MTTNKANYPTLKEAYLKEETSAGDELKRFIQSNVDDEATRWLVDKNYAYYFKLIEEAGYQPESFESDSFKQEERSFRQNQDIHSFFKHLLSKTKRQLQTKVIDWKEVPSIEEVESLTVKAVLHATEQKDMQQQVFDKTETQAMSPEKFADKMHHGHYGKLD